MPDPARILPLALAFGAALCGAPALAQRVPPTLPGKVPSYKIEALSFRCNDETGYDSPWWAPWISDEIRVGIGTPSSGTVSREFGDVDTDEHRSFGPEESCILPIEGQGSGVGSVLVAPGDRWACNALGVPGPFNFTVVMAETDSDLFDCLGSLGQDCDFDGPGPSVPGPGDDLIGRKTLSFPLADLAAAMPFVGDQVEETAILGPCHDGRECVITPGGPSPAEYTFTYRVTRLPDTFPPLQPSP